MIIREIGKYKLVEDWAYWDMPVVLIEERIEGG